MSENFVPFIDNTAKTSCERCIFARYAAPPCAQVAMQVGCAMNRTKKFLERGATLQLKLLPDDRVCHTIDRVCMAARNEDWAKANLGPLDEQLQKVRQEITLQFHCVVYADTADFDAVLRTVDSLTKGTLRPRTLQIVLNYDKQQPSALVRAMNERYNDCFEKWFIATQKHAIGPDGKLLETRQGKGKSLDIALHDCVRPVYVVFSAGYEVATEFLAGIDRAVSDELEQFAVLTGDDQDNGLVVIHKVHKDYDGNDPVEIVFMDKDVKEGEQPQPIVIEGIANKVRYVAEQTGKLRLVRAAEEFVCNQ